MDKEGEGEKYWRWISNVSNPLLMEAEPSSSPATSGETRLCRRRRLARLPSRGTAAAAQLSVKTGFILNPKTLQTRGISLKQPSV